MSRRRPSRSLLAVALLLSAGCAKETTGFPPGVESWDDPAAAPAEWPEMPSVPGTVALVTGGRLSTGTTPAYFWAHGRVTLAASIADVWSAIQWQPGVLLAVFPDTQVDCEPKVGVEAGYEVSFSVREIPNDFGDIGRANWFVVNWRADATRDAAQAVQKVNVKAQKVDGTTYIPLMRQSIVVVAAPGGGSALDIVRHINARNESEVSAGDWIRLWVQALDAQVKGTREALIPSSRCFP